MVSKHHRRGRLGFAAAGVLLAASFVLGACSAEGNKTTPTDLPTPTVPQLLTEVQDAVTETANHYQLALTNHSIDDAKAALEASHKLDTPMQTLSDFARTDDEAKTALQTALQAVSTREQLVLRSDTAVEAAIAQVTSDQELSDNTAIAEARTLVCYDIDVYLNQGRRPTSDEYIGFARNRLKKLTLTDTLITAAGDAEQQHSVIKILNTVRQGDEYEKTIYRTSLTESRTCEFPNV